ncbi:hypothetical protein [Azospirillum argentinense]
MSSNGTVGISLPADLYAEFILRKGESVDVTSWIINVIEDYLERTKHDEEWCDSYKDRMADDLLKDVNLFGDTKYGYQWSTLFLPNGTRIRMQYKGAYHYAVISNEKIIVMENESPLFDGHYSPSEFASRVANNTQRNAWRDLWIKRPMDRDWTLADELRRHQ